MATAATVMNAGRDRRRQPRVARILLADADLASRLALKTLLSTAGYAVDCAASTAHSRHATTDPYATSADQGYRGSKVSCMQLVVSFRAGRVSDYVGCQGFCGQTEFAGGQ